MGDKDKVQISDLTLPEKEEITFGELTQATMGNATPVEVVAANSERRALLLCNTSDTTGYFSFGDGTGLTTAVYSFSLATGIPLALYDEKICKQAIMAICGQASKSVTYQEGA